MGIDDDIDEPEATAQRRQRDFDDLQNEIAGNATGRASRFLSQESGGREAAEKRQSERAEMLTRLQILMQDPAYAKLYQDTLIRLGEAERATERALTKALERQRAADKALTDLQDRALKLEDGRRVYRDASGTFRTENGLAISDSETDAIAEQWHPGMPGYEDYRARREEAEAEAEAVDEIRKYQTDVLGGARDRMTDEDDPPSAEEIEATRDRLASTMPETVHAEMQPAAQVAVVPDQQPASTLAKPAL